MEKCSILKAIELGIVNQGSATVLTLGIGSNGIEGALNLSLGRPIR